MKSTIPLMRTKADDESDSSSASASEARLQDLLARYGVLLRRTIAKVCPSQMAAALDDIEQEARIRLWKALQHERDIVHPVSYIYKVAVSATLRAIRRAQARREEPLREPDAVNEVGSPDALRTSAETSPEATAERSEWLRKIDTAMARLPDNRRLAVGLHLQGLTTQQIGDILGWTEPKARNLVHRGLKDLRRELRAEGIEYSP
jgi:RNA polymerase sigma factor (sigma-70 family)